MEEISFGEHDKLARKIREKAGRGGAYRAPIAGLCGLIDHARETHDRAREARQLEVLALLDMCALDLQHDIQVEPLREALLRLALARPARGVARGVLERIWREPRRCKASWRGPEFKRWLCDLPWSYGDRERAAKLVEAAQDEVWDDDALLPMLVDNFPSSLRALTRRREASAVPAEHAVGLFMRHVREGAPDAALLLWMWRGVSVSERDQLLLVMQESPRVRAGLTRDVLEGMWLSTLRFQEHTALLRVWGLLPSEPPTRALVVQALMSEHAALRGEAIATLRRLGSPSDVPALLAASEGREEAERRLIEEAIRAIQTRAGSAGLDGALTLQEEASERGGLSLAGAQAGELTDAREASAGGEATSALVPAAAGAPSAMVRREASGWLEAAPAPRRVAWGARLAYLGLAGGLRDHVWALCWSALPTLVTVLLAQQHMDGVRSAAICAMLFGHFISLPVLYERRSRRLRALGRGAIMMGEVEEGGRAAVVDGVRYPLARRWRGALEAQPVIVEGGQVMLAAEFGGLEVSGAGEIVASRWRAAAGVAALVAINHITLLLIPGGLLACIIGALTKG